MPDKPTFDTILLLAIAIAVWIGVFAGWNVLAN